ncbi:MAG: hypothetical protein QM632_06755 [Micrococcaceae bacterium]
MEKILALAARYRKPLLIVIAALFFTIIINAVKPPEQHCPQINTLNPTVKPPQALAAKHQAVPLSNVDESILASISENDTVTVTLLASQKDFSNLKVLSSSPRTIVLQVPEKQAVEVAKAQHEKFLIRLQTFTPNEEGAAPGTIDPSQRH